MAKGQKDSVVEEVQLALGSAFIKGQTNAILALTTTQLENIKANVFNGIINGTIEYGKDPNNHTEARSYARSMVMNHLKKAKELNGGLIYKTVPTAITGDTDETGTSAYQSPRTVAKKVQVGPKGVNMEVLSEEMKELAKSLI